ncbi:hypothetical protein H0H93_009402 [Arthromyces matolae]|nr:hypothetical protein H0H93_009402 [Arthromyces matolae]
MKPSFFTYVLAACVFVTQLSGVAASPLPLSARNDLSTLEVRDLDNLGKNKPVPGHQPPSQLPPAGDLSSTSSVTASQGATSQPGSTFHSTPSSPWQHAAASPQPVGSDGPELSSSRTPTASTAGRPWHASRSNSPPTSQGQQAVQNPTPVDSKLQESKPPQTLGQQPKHGGIEVGRVVAHAGSSTRVGDTYNGVAPPGGWPQGNSIRIQSMVIHKDSNVEFGNVYNPSAGAEMFHQTPTFHIGQNIRVQGDMRQPPSTIPVGTPRTTTVGAITTTGTSSVDIGDHFHGPHGNDQDPDSSWVTEMHEEWDNPTTPNSPSSTASHFHPPSASGSGSEKGTAAHVGDSDPRGGSIWVQGVTLHNMSPQQAEAARRHAAQLRQQFGRPSR